MYEAVMGLRTADKTGCILADEMGLGACGRGMGPDQRLALWVGGTCMTAGLPSSPATPL